MDSLGAVVPDDYLFTLEKLSAQDAPALLEWMKNETYSTIISFATSLDGSAMAYTARTEAGQAFGLFIYFNHKINTTVPKKLRNGDYVLQITANPVVTTKDNMLLSFVKKCVDLVNNNTKDAKRLFWEIDPREKALLKVARVLGFKTIYKKKFLIIVELKNKKPL